MRTLALEKLQAKISVREGGRERRMTKGEIGVTKLVNRFAESGDPKLFMVLSKELDGAAGRKEASGGSERAAQSNASHAEILAWFLEQNRTGGNEGDGS